MSSDRKADGGATTAYLEAGGEIYPLKAREEFTEKSQTVPRRGSETKKGLVESIRQQFHERFVMDLDGAEYTDNDTLLEDYRHDIGIMRKACDEVCDFLKLLYRLNTDIELQSDEVALIATDEQAMSDLQYQNWSKNIKDRVTLGDYSLSIRLTDLMEEEGPRVLVRRREECLDDFIRQFCQLLDEMVDAELVGLVTFGKNRDCEFYFFREVVVHFETDRQTITRENNRRILSEDLWTQKIELTGTQFDILRHKSTVQRIRQDVYLRDVTKAGYGLSRMEIPLGVHDFLAMVPPWLRNSCRIVEGERYYQKFFKQEIEHENWEQTEVRPFHQIVIEQTHRDPALTLGHYVLTGWDDTDVKQQNSEREVQWREEYKASDAGVARKFGYSLLLAAVICLLMAMAMLLQLPKGIGSNMATLGVAASVVFGIGWFHFSGKSLRKRLNSLHYILAGILLIGITMPMLGVAMAIRDQRWSLLWLLILSPLLMAVLTAIQATIPDEES